MADDPYAQYLTPPSAAGGGGDPYAKYLAPPGATAAPAQSGGKSNAYQPTWLDKVTNVANPTLGLSDIVNSGLGSVIESRRRPHTDRR